MKKIFLTIIGVVGIIGGAQTYKNWKENDLNRKIHFFEELTFNKIDEENYEFLSKEAKVYNEFGAITKHEVDEPYKKEMTLYNYDLKGNLVDVSVYDGQRQLFNKTKMFYNDQNLKVKEEVYNADLSKPYIHREFIYNDKNQMIHSKSFGTNETPFQEMMISYDNQNRISKEIARNNFEGMELGKEFIYDEKGRKSQINDISFGKIVKKELLKYDDFGNPTEILILIDDKEFSKETFSYEYDKRNHWTKKLIFKDSKEIKKVERKIEYHQ